MKYTSGSVGRIITIRFEDGDAIYDGIEDVAEKEEIESGVVWLIGGVKNGAVVVGPSSDAMPPIPMVERFADAREIAGIGTIFSNESGQPSLHMHASIGKGTSPLVGCPRMGLDCWLITEAVIMEINDLEARRMKDAKSGFTLLEVGVRL